MHIISLFFRCLLLLCALNPFLQSKTTFSKHQYIAPASLTNKNEPPQPKEIIRDVAPLEQKEWNIFFYIAGNNNMHSFVDVSINQLRLLSSSSRINFIVQVDKFGTKDVTRSIIQNNQINTYWRASDTPALQRAANPSFYNSGGVENFIDFIQTGIALFPAKNQCVIVWDHGSGCYDPTKWRMLRDGSPEDFSPTRGMAFNDNYNLFLSNQDLTRALQEVSKNALNGKSIDILGLDICHGGQIEIAQQAAGAVDYIVASEEFELGSGWNYIKCFTSACTQSKTPLELCTDIINAYKAEFNAIAPDYTLALYDLVSRPPNEEKTYFECLLGTMHNLSLKLLELAQSSAKKIITQTLTTVRKKNALCCSFYDDEYIDLHLFLMSLQSNLRQVISHDSFRQNNPESFQKIHDAIQLCILALNNLYKVIPVYTAGIAFAGNPIRARGMSITFPLTAFHSSYGRTLFAQTNSWFTLIKGLLSNFK